MMIFIFLFFPSRHTAERALILSAMTRPLIGRRAFARRGGGVRPSPRSDAAPRGIEPPTSAFRRSRRASSSSATTPRRSAGSTSFPPQFGSTSRAEIRTIRASTAAISSSVAARDEPFRPTNEPFRPTNGTDERIRDGARFAGNARRLPGNARRRGVTDRHRTAVTRAANDEPPVRRERFAGDDTGQRVEPRAAIVET